MTQKIAVLAAGANGSCIGADLTRAGLDVALIDQWPAHVEAMRADGLTIRTKDDGPVTTPVTAYHLCDVCTLHDTFDLVLLTSKAYDSRWLTEFIEPYLADDGLIVAVQNGMTAEDIGEIVGMERTVGCVVELSSQMFEPADILRNTPPRRTWFGVGAFDDAHADRVEEVAAVLRHAGRVDITDDIIAAKWMKLIVNAMTMGLKAILGATNEQVFKIDGARDLFLRAGEEALTAGQILGHRVVPVIGLTAEQVASTNSLLETLLEKIVHDVGPTAINTVLQDHIKGRYSEINLINGLVSDACRAEGRPTPVSDAIVAISKRLHAGELKPDVANFGLIRAELGS
jgi:2-dehydropantoate 2-reductase